jgi:hypothetical protein
MAGTGARLASCSKRRMLSAWSFLVAAATARSISCFMSSVSGCPVAFSYSLAMTDTLFTIVM